MKIPRTLLNSLISWKLKPARLPLILKGVRQVGKSTLVEDFGLREFENFIKCDFEKNRNLQSIFEQYSDPKEILKQLTLILNLEIIPGKSLLFLDEIQTCPRALTALKYFAEDLPELHIIAAGSHLGLLLAGVYDNAESFSFPVGKVEYLELFPVTFFEFLDFFEQKELLEYVILDLKSLKISEALHLKLLEYWRLYLAIGGMPQVIIEYKNNLPKGLLVALNSSRERQEFLIMSYEADIAKHSGKINAQQIVRTLRAIPSKLGVNLDQRTSRFTFKDVVPGIRGYERLAGAIDWLTSAGLAYRVPLVKVPKTPLKGFEDETFFKFYFFEIGLFGALSGIPINHMLELDYGMYKGFIAETFVLQEMKSKKNFTSLACYHNQDSEIEFLIDGSNGICPVEVKSSHNIRSRSLSNYEKKYQPQVSYLLSGQIQISKEQSRRKYLPIYLAELVGFVG